jgi:hypothetical protein
MLVDQYSRKTWCYGLKDLTSPSISDAFWRFFMDAGGFPRRIQCDFDQKFLGGPTNRLFRSKGIHLKSAPPYCQSQNGLVESHWRVASNMARSFLAEAGLPKRFWFWAVREATIRMNMVPCVTGVANLLTTPFETFYGIKPDLRTLFPFGSIGYYRRPRDGSRGARTNFESQSFVGIALGRADTSNGMLFWNPTLSRFCVSAGYRLDDARAVADPFPTLVYDGGLHLRLYTNNTTSLASELLLAMLVRVLSSTLFPPPRMTY